MMELVKKLWVGILLVVPLLSSYYTHTHTHTHIHTTASNLETTYEPALDAVTCQLEFTITQKGFLKKSQLPSGLAPVKIQSAMFNEFSRSLPKGRYFLIPKLQR